MEENNKRKSGTDGFGLFVGCLFVEGDQGSNLVPTFFRTIFFLSPITLNTLESNFRKFVSTKESNKSYINSTKNNRFKVLDVL